jgi:hypothetical protein
VRANIIKLIKIVRRAKNSRKHLQVVFSHWPIQVKICNAAQLMQAKAGLDNIQMPACNYSISSDQEWRTRVQAASF